MKILYVVTSGEMMGFFKSFIKELLIKGHTVDIAANETISKIPDCFCEWGCKVHSISCCRLPFNSGNIRAIKEIRDVAEREKYDIVHCHTPVAAMCTRLACRTLRKGGLKVFYTAHGFHFYKGAPLKNWLLYYSAEWLCAHWTDALITINHEDYACAKKHLHAKRVEYAPGVGIDIDRFASAVVDRTEKRREIGVPEDAFLLMSVGELNPNKNHEVVLRALAQTENGKIHYAIAGRGPLQDYLTETAKTLGISEQVHLLGYREDVPELYKAADCCVFPSIREGFGLAALEGVAAGLPLICADNRGTREYVVAGEDMVCNCNNVSEFADAICKFYQERPLKRDTTYVKKFCVETVNKRMHEIYVANGLIVSVKAVGV